MAHALPRWVVLIEEAQARGEGNPRAVTESFPAADQAAARELAERLTATYHPRIPRHDAKREIYRRSADHWIVVVEGNSRFSHFEVIVAEHVASHG